MVLLLKLLTKKQLKEVLNLPSTRMIDELMRRRNIPYLRLGHRTVRFELTAVEKALSKLEVREIGREKGKN